MKAEYNTTNIKKNPFIERMLKLTSNHMQSGFTRRKKIEELGQEKESLNTSPNRLSKITEDIAALNIQAAEAQAAFESGIESIGNEYINAVKRWGLPCSENLPDHAILSGLIELTAGDLTGLEEKYMGNETMARASQDSATTNGLNWG